MKTTSDEGGSEAGATSNVVRLPRDWLGPRDELVPVGPRSDAAGGGIAGADDFWGEQSASLQDAWQGPAPFDPEGAADARVATPTGGGFGVRARARWFAPRPRWLGTAAAIAACLAIVLGNLAGGSSHGTAARETASRGTAGARAVSARTVRLGLEHRTVVWTQLSKSRAGRRSRRVTHKVRMPARTSRGARRDRGSVGGSPTDVAQETQTAAPTDVALTQSSDPVTSGSAPAAVAHSSPPKAGPAGAGAPFGPGHLNRK